MKGKNELSQCKPIDQQIKDGKVKRMLSDKEKAFVQLAAQIIVEKTLRDYEAIRNKNTAGDK